MSCSCPRGTWWELGRRGVVKGRHRCCCSSSAACVSLCASLLCCCACAASSSVSAPALLPLRVEGTIVLVCCVLTVGPRRPTCRRHSLLNAQQQTPVINESQSGPRDAAAAARCFSSLSLAAAGRVQQLLLLRCRAVPLLCCLLPPPAAPLPPITPHPARRAGAPPAAPQPRRTRRPRRARAT